MLKRVRGIELRFYMVAAHYRSHVEFCFEALDEAAAGFRRIENFLERAGDRPASAGELPEAFVDAMDDDLGTPAAVAVLYDAVREGNRLLADRRGRRGRAPRRCARCSTSSASTPPTRPGRAAAASDDRADRTRSTCWSPGCSSSATEARADKDFATADAIRDQIKAAGIEIEDTPDGPKWTLVHD